MLEEVPQGSLSLCTSPCGKNNNRCRGEALVREFRPSNQARTYTENVQGDQCDQHRAAILVGPGATLQADAEEAERPRTTATSSPARLEVHFCCTGWCNGRRCASRHELICI